MRVNEIQQQIGRGEYQVDTHAVAEAILRRLMPGHVPGDQTASDGRPD